MVILMKNSYLVNVFREGIFENVFFEKVKFDFFFLNIWVFLIFVLRNTKIFQAWGKKVIFPEIYKKLFFKKI